MSTVVTTAVVFTLLQFYAMFKFDARTSAGPIDYRQASSSRTHFIPVLNMYMGKCFQYGNRKLADNIAIFSLKEVLTCLTCDKYGCTHSCYALKASTQYKTAFNFRLLMSWLACNDLQLLENFIREDLDRLPAKIDTVRIHEAGEFVSQAYVNMWARIVKDYPQYDFYCYTKTIELFDFSGLVAAGCAVNNSVINGEKNYGDQDYLNKLKAENPDIFICSYGLENAAKCGQHGAGGCRYCMTATGKIRRPCFHDHSKNTGKKTKRNKKTAA